MSYDYSLIYSLLADKGFTTENIDISEVHHEEDGIRIILYDVSNKYKHVLHMVFLSQESIDEKQLEKEELNLTDLEQAFKKEIQNRGMKNE